MERTIGVDVVQENVVAGQTMELRKEMKMFIEHCNHPRYNSALGCACQPTSTLARGGFSWPGESGASVECRD